MRLARDVCGIVLVGIMAGLVHAHLKPLRLSLPSTVPIPSGQAPADAIPGELRNTVISIDDAKTLLARMGAEFLDARPAEEYRAGRIKGAHSLPPDVFYTGEIPSFVDSMPRSLEYVIYCQSSECDAAVLVALRLREYGYENLRILVDGYEKWIAAGGAVEK